MNRRYEMSPTIFTTPLGLRIGASPSELSQPSRPTRERSARPHQPLPIGHNRADSLWRVCARVRPPTTGLPTPRDYGFKEGRRVAESFLGTFVGENSRDRVAPCHRSCSRSSSRRRRARSHGLRRFATGDTSWVDRMWSIVPVIYVWVFAAYAHLDNPRWTSWPHWSRGGEFDSRFTFARKGGSQRLEDYRWP